MAEGGLLTVCMEESIKAKNVARNTRLVAHLCFYTGILFANGVHRMPPFSQRCKITILLRLDSQMR